MHGATTQNDAGASSDASAPREGVLGADPEDAGPRPCTNAQDCDDGVFCNGAERCEDQRCSAAVSGPCLLASQCSEFDQRCDCDFDRDGLKSARCGGTDCDEDHDKHEAPECGGDDCDDTNPLRYGGNAEVCDEAGLDEDCDPSTVAGPARSDDPVHFDANRDRDGDGAMNPACVNVGTATASFQLDAFYNYDCDDTNPAVYPGAPEICDGVDNNCNGAIDEIDGSQESFGLRHTYCLDGDGDGCGTHAMHVTDCGPPAHYVPCELADAASDDCDDTDPEMHPGPKVIEVCDGKDNDCDGKVDQDDHDVDPLPDQATLGRDTDVVCRNGEWLITRCPDGFMWCHHDTVVRGCETDVRELENCHSCEATTCQFSCGEQGCDEALRISVGYAHACVVTREGRAACWGQGSEGRLGNDGVQSSSTPVLVTGLQGVSQIAAGPAHSCAIVGADHALYCWGNNESNQLGSPERDTFNPAPVSVVGMTESRMRNVARIALGLEHTCVVTDTGVAICWGEQTNGRLGDDQPNATGTGNPRRVRRAVSSGFDYVTDANDIQAGDLHTCVVTQARTIECWGDNADQQLGDPSLGEQLFFPYANPVPGVVNVSQLAVGNYHTCALADGKVRCWGLNANLQLGRPSDEHDGEALPVPGLSDIVSIAAGAQFTCALTAAGQTLCWGALLGLPDEAMTPQLVTALDGTQQLVAGGVLCGLDRQSRAFCLGQNFYGQLGNGSTSLNPVPTPAQLAPLSKRKP